MSNINEWIGGLDFLDGVGTAGVLAYVGAYLALQLGVVKGDGYIFPSVNLAASLAVLFSLTRDFNPFSVTIEICWSVISVIGITRIYIIHRFVRLTEEEAEVARRIVPSLKKDSARRLLKLGRFTDADEGTILTEQGKSVVDVAMIMGGLCHIERNGKHIASISVGALVGELTLATGAPSTATVRCVVPSRLIRNNRDMLWGFLQRNPEAMADMERSIAGDLRLKLTDTSTRLSSALGDGSTLSN